MRIEPQITESGGSTLESPFKPITVVRRAAFDLADGRTALFRTLHTFDECLNFQPFKARNRPVKIGTLSESDRNRCPV